MLLQTMMSTKLMHGAILLKRLPHTSGIVCSDDRHIFVLCDQLETLFSVCALTGMVVHTGIYSRSKWPTLI